MFHRHHTMQRREGKGKNLVTDVRVTTVVKGRGKEYCMISKRGDGEYRENAREGKAATMRTKRRRY